MLLGNRPLFTGFMPNLTWRDAIAAWYFLCCPWKWLKWKKGNAPKKVEEWLSTYTRTSHAITYSSGSTGLFFALQALDISQDDEVLVQAFTCVVVINAIKWAGATPVFVDIDEHANMDPKDAEKKISKKTKAIIIQHTFGYPAQTAKLLALAKKHDLRTIEDCAHALGLEINGKKAGSLADIGMFSFGSDKVISCGRGGALTTNNDLIAKRLYTQQRNLPYPSTQTVAKQLYQPVVFALAKPCYNIFAAGKIALFIAKKLRLTPRIIEPCEKKGKQKKKQHTKLPNALAAILLNQIKHIDRTNAHRKTIANIYSQKLLNQNAIFVHPSKSVDNLFLRFSLTHKKRTEILKAAKKQGIILGDWYTTVIAPKDTAMQATGYKAGSCPKAEALAKTVFNLPTNRNIKKRDALRIVGLINKHTT